MSNSKIRCLFVHNRYLIRGGEDNVADEEVKLLKQNGHEVHLYEINNLKIDSFRKKIQTGFEITYSPNAKESLAKELKRFKPDIVHVHNFFPLLTPAIYDACIENNIPVIQTLHNFRLICPGALLLRDGNICERCITGSPYNAVIHKCYRSSRLQSLAVARMVSYHRKNNTWANKVTRFIALTEFSKSKFVAAGFPSTKITVKPNFVNGNTELEMDSNESDIQNEINRKTYALYVGRLSKEKGINTLLDAWENINFNLNIAGDNMLESQLPTTNSNIKFLGELSSHEIRTQMRGAQFLIMPSICFETFGMVIVEAFSNKIPVIASNLGAMADIVEHNKTGLLFKAGNSIDLTNRATYLIENPQKSKEMGIHAYKLYKDRFTPDRNYDLLINIYNEAISTIK